MCSRNTLRESSHISFFCGGVPFCEVVQLSENIHDTFAWVTRRSLFAWENSRPLLFAWATSGSLPRPKLQTLYYLSSPLNTPLRRRIFLFMAGYRNLHTSGLFSGNLLILSTNVNICHSIHRQQIIFSPSSFIFLFPVRQLCWCYLATALNQLSTSSPLL